MTDYTEIKPKYAMVIPAYQRFLPMSEWTPKLLDRNGPTDFCEKDPTHLQLLVYVTLVDEKGAVFSYQRGGSGGEERLYNLRSIGLGGHADTPIQESQSIVSYLAEHACREVQEEVGWLPDNQIMQKAVTNALKIYTPITEVDQVHLGLSVTLTVPDRNALTKLEEGHIEKPAWFEKDFLNTYAAIAAVVKTEALVFQFETWSQVYLKVTATSDTEQSYRAKIAKQESLFVQYAALVDMFSQKVPSEPHDNPTLRINSNFTLQVQMDRSSAWKEITYPPFDPRSITSIHDGVGPSKVAGASPIRVFTFFIGNNDIAYSTSDFLVWDQTIGFSYPENHSDSEI